MISVIIRIGIDQIVKIGEHHSEVEVSTDRTIEEGCNMLIPIGMISWEKIIEVKILEVDMEVIIEMTTLEEVEVGLEKESIRVILEGMTEAVAIGLDQVWEPVLTDIGLHVINVGNMIILLRTVWICKQKKSQNRCNKCII